MSRDEDQARKFAVEWATKGKGKIANLAGCYLRVSGDLAKLQRQCRELVAHWDEIHEFKADETGLWRGIEEIRESCKEPA